MANAMIKETTRAKQALSPVRAVEWIYVDGLRKMYGWNSTAGGAREG